MKKYAALAGVTLILAGILLSLPVFSRQLLISAEVIHPWRQIVREDVYVSGQVEEQSKKDVYVQLPLVPEQVGVEIGDRVEANQVLAKVDAAATRAALFSLVETAGLLPEEYVAVMGGLSKSGGLSEELSAGISDLLPDGGILEARLAEELIPAEIRAPASGVVTALSLVPGAIAQPQSAVCTISKLDVLRLKLSVEEAFAEEIQSGDQVVFKTGATGDQLFEGRVTELFPTAQQALVGTSQQTIVSFYAEIQGDPSRLRPGYTVNGVVRKDAGTPGLAVPYEAVLQDEQNQEYVYVYEKARAVRRNIQTGAELANGVIVTKGLSEDELLIADGSAVRGENCRIRPVYTGGL